MALGSGLAGIGLKIGSPTMPPGGRSAEMILAPVAAAVSPASADYFPAQPGDLLAWLFMLVMIPSASVAILFLITITIALTS